MRSYPYSGYAQRPTSEKAADVKLKDSKLDNVFSNHNSSFHTSSWNRPDVENAIRVSATSISPQNRP